MASGVGRLWGSEMTGAVPAEFLDGDAAAAAAWAWAGLWADAPAVLRGEVVADGALGVVVGGAVCPVLGVVLGDAVGVGVPPALAEAELTTD